MNNNRLLKSVKPRSEFTKNVLTLITGTTIAQAIPIAISPILTRLYSPKDFGVLALFVAITSIFGSIANGRYELAIMLPKKDEDAINIMALGFILNLGLSLFLLFIVISFHDEILKLLNNNEISLWLYLVPISVFLMGCFNLLNYFNNRKKFFKDLAKSNVYKSIGMAIVQLSIGIVKSSAWGLVSGQIFSQIILNAKLFLNVKKSNLLTNINGYKIIALSKKFKKFPFYSLPNGIVDSIREQGFNILLSNVYSLSTLGQYYLAQRIIRIPMSMIVNSISQILLQKMSTTKEEQLFNIVLKYIIKSTLIFLPMFTISYLFAENIFIFIFGLKWTISGKIASLLSPWMFLSFLTSPLANIFVVLQKQEIVLLYAIIYATIPILLIVLYNKNFLILIKILSFLMSLVLILFLFHIIYITKNLSRIK